MTKLKSGSHISRRALLAGAGVGMGGLLSGCDAFNESPGFRGVLKSAEDANFVVQRSLGSRMALAHEYPESARSPYFRGNGTQDPDTPEYDAMEAAGFENWQLDITGLVREAQSFTLNAIRAMPQRRQTTRHDCVEGWSAIGTWTGVPLKLLLDRAGLLDSAKYLVFRCADVLSGSPYYESIDLIDAYHPQTIIAHMLNDAPLPVRNGAPLRLRVERHLGYKHAKFIHTIEVVDSLAGIGEGKGGYWEDRSDYQWYAGI